MLLPFYQRAIIPAFPSKIMKREIKMLWEELRSINRIPKAKRAACFERVNSFKAKLDRTMKLWPLDAIERMQNEDKLFLQSMMADSVATLGPVENVLNITEKKIQGRRNREEQQRKKEVKRRARWMAKII